VAGANLTFSSDTADAANEVLRQPGRLVADPTDTGGSAPAYGGTTLGRLERGSVFEHGVAVEPLVCREDSRRPYDAVVLGTDGLILRATLAQWSTDTVQLWFPGMTAPVSTRRKVQFPGGTFPRLASVADTFLLAFVPNDVARHQALVIRSATPYADPERGLAWRVNAYGSLDALFLALPSGFATAAEDYGVIGRWTDLALS